MLDKLKRWWRNLFRSEHTDPSPRQNVDSFWMASGYAQAKQQIAQREGQFEKPLMTWHESRDLIDKVQKRQKKEQGNDNPGYIEGSRVVELGYLHKLVADEFRGVVYKRKWKSIEEKTDKQRQHMFDKFNDTQSRWTQEPFGIASMRDPKQD